jgi:membrane protein implicated in regulation of membrane protease activity
LRKLFREKILGKEKHSKEELADEFVGRSVIAETDFDEYGNGKVAFRGSTWNAKARNTVRKGDQLRIVGKHNIHLEVEPQGDKQ